MKIIFSVFSICLFVLSACEKEDVAPRLRRETAEKMMGKWMVDRTIDEVYDPLPTLSSTTETTGTPDDYFYFKTESLAEIKSANLGIKEEEYRVWNPYQVMIGNVSWRIDQLTQSQLVLIWDRNDAAQYKRFVTKVYLVRLR